MINVQMTRKLYENAACPKELLIVEGAGHAQAQDKEPAVYYGMVREFLQKTMRSSDGINS